MELDAKVLMMEKLAGPSGIKLPQTMFGGTGNSNSQNGMLEAIIGAKLLSGEIGTK